MPKTVSLLIPIDQHTDKQLITKIQREDKVAFRSLFNRYYQKLLGTAINMLKNVDLAKDTVQEVFLQIWKDRAKLPDISSVEGYLKRAVINRCLNKIKAQKSFVGEEQLASKSSKDPSAVEQLEVDDVKKALKKALDTLPERCRLVFMLKRVEGLSQKEIAEKLDISTKTVENQMTKALKLLKEAMKPFVNKSG